MKKLRILLTGLLLTVLSSLSGYAQDSLICITPQEAQAIKAAIEACDAVKVELDHVNVKLRRAEQIIFQYEEIDKVQKRQLQELMKRDKVRVEQQILTDKELKKAIKQNNFLRGLALGEAGVILLFVIILL